MRLGLVMPLGDFRGGVERMLVNLLSANRQGPAMDISVAFMEDGPLVEQVRSMGYEARTIAAGRLRDPMAYARAARAFGRWLDDTAPDAVLSWAAKGHLYVGLPARRRRIPTAWFLHAIPDGHWMDRLTTAVPADLVLCCSTAAERAQRALRPTRKTHVAGISVDLDAFDPDSLPAAVDARAALGLPASGPLVTMVARLQRWKGVHVFVAAAARLADNWPDAHFVVVGGEHAMEPGYRDELEAGIRRAGLEGRFMLAGLQQNVPLWMQAADVLVHASFDEPAGAVIIEGMALGKPVVAARTAGPMEFITDGVDGRLATPGDPAELAAVLDELLRDAPQRARLGAAAADRGREFSAPRFAAGIAASMQQIVDNRSAAAGA